MNILIFGDTSTWNMPNFCVDKINPEIREKIKKADYVIYNLEGPIGKSGKDYSLQLRENRLKDLWFKMLLKIGNKEQPVVRSDKSIVELLRLNPNTLVTLANNHIKDLGREGFEDTIKLLQKNGIGYVGAGRTDAEASFRYSLSENIVIYNLNLVSSKKRGIPFRIYDAGPNEYGAASLSLNKLTDEVKKDAGKRKILLLHNGSEMQVEEDDPGIDFRSIQKVDVDIVAVTHTHRYHETQHEKEQIYILGDFIFSHLSLFSSRMGACIEICDSFSARVRKYPLNEMYDQE